MNIIVIKGGSAYLRILQLLSMKWYNTDRRVNRLANLIEPVMGSVSPVVTSKPRPGHGAGQNRTGNIYPFNDYWTREAAILSYVRNPLFHTTL